MESRSSAGIADASPRVDVDGFTSGVEAVRRAVSAGVAGRPCSSAAWVSLALPVLVRPVDEGKSNLVEVPPLRIARRNAMSSLACLEAVYVSTRYRLQRNSKRAQKEEVEEGRVLKSSRVGRGRHCS